MSDDIYVRLCSIHDSIVEQRMRDMSLKPHTLKPYADPNESTVYSEAADEIKRLRDEADHWQQIIDEHKVEITEKEYEHFQKLRHMFRSSYPEQFEGQIFICGVSSAMDETGMPERIHVCRAYGSDYVKFYKRID